MLQGLCRILCYVESLRCESQVSHEQLGDLGKLPMSQKLSFFLCKMGLCGRD